MPAPAWKDIAKRTYKRTWDDNVGLVAAGVAFYGFFALLSLLGLIVLIYGFVADPRTVIEHMRTLLGILPRDVVVLIDIGASGRVSSIKVKTSSGYEVLDAQALEMFGQAVPQVPVPAELRGRAFTVELRAVYNLRDRPG